MNLGLDEEALIAIFCLPKGPNKVEQRLNNVNGIPLQSVRFSADAACSHRFRLKKRISNHIMERLVFQRYALQMQENRSEIAAIQIFQA